jgi:hypothetical protein
MPKGRGNYSSCTGRSSENICSSSSSGGAQEKGKQDETQFITINIWSPLGLVGLVPLLEYRSL